MAECPAGELAHAAPAYLRPRLHVARNVRRRRGTCKRQPSHRQTIAFDCLAFRAGYQKTELMNLRNPDNYQYEGAFLFSQPTAMPGMPGTDSKCSARYATAGEREGTGE